MKRIVSIVAVVFGIILVAAPLAASPDPAQRRELELKAEQLAEEIAEWKKQLADLVDDLYNPFKIWVNFTDGSVLAVDDQKLMNSLKLDWLTTRTYQAAFLSNEGIRDLRLEDKVFMKEDLQAFIKESYAKLVAQDKINRAAKEKDAERLGELIGKLEARYAAALRERSAGAPEFKPDTQGDLQAGKKAWREKVDKIRQEESWNPFHHTRAATAIDRSKTFEQLSWAETLVGEYSACYAPFHAEMARIAAANKAGRYRIPGDRIAEEDKAKGVLAQRTEAAWARYEANFKR